MKLVNRILEQTLEESVFSSFTSNLSNIEKMVTKLRDSLKKNKKLFKLNATTSDIKELDAALSDIFMSAVKGQLDIPPSHLG